MQNRNCFRTRRYVRISNFEKIDQSFVGGRHCHLRVFYIIQTWPSQKKYEKSIKQSNIIQINVESCLEYLQRYCRLWYVIWGIQAAISQSSVEDYNYTYTDTAERKFEGKKCITIERKEIYVECTPQGDLF